ncbi:MAG: DUF58 domain-containing protein [Blastopirellula sp. JB062]
MNTQPKTTLRDLLTRDYTPWANRYVYWLKTPLGILISAACVSLVLGFFVTPQGFTLVGAIVGVLMIGIAWPWLGLRGIGCKIRFSTARCEENADVALHVEVANRWPFPVWGLALERGFFGEDSQDDSAVVSLARIPGWSTCRFSFPFQPEIRGAYPQVAPLITTEFPFGLWKANRTCEVAETLIVRPRIYPLAALPLPAGTAQQLFTPSDHRAGDEGERIGARPYRQGDSLRNVHWAQTARCDRLIVCERQGAAQTDVGIVIDCQAENHFGEGPDATIHWALRIGASVAHALSQQNIRVTIEMGDQYFPLDASPSSWRKMYDAMARLKPSHGPRPVPRQRQALRIVIRTSQAEPFAHETRAIVLDSTGSGLAASSHAAEPWLKLDPLTAAAELQPRWNKRRQEEWRCV